MSERALSWCCSARRSTQSGAHERALAADKAKRYHEMLSEQLLVEPTHAQWLPADRLERTTLQDWADCGPEVSKLYE